MGSLSSGLLGNMSPRCGCFWGTVVMCVTVVAPQLLAPRDVRLTSYNMDLYLRWSPPEHKDSEVLYSTQLWATSQERPRAACVNTTAQHCELSDPSLGLGILEFGQYNASVRAQSGSKVSEWVNSQTIMMDRDTVIGPPGVSIVSNGADLEVIVKEPKFSVSTITHVFGPPQYNISYWPRGGHIMGHKLVQQNRAVLMDLEPWSEYCIQVRVYVNPGRTRNPAEASETVCQSTEGKPPAPWIAVVLTFFALALTVALVVVIIVFHKRMSHCLCPKDTLPEHLPERPHSVPHLTLIEEVYHPLNVVPSQSTQECSVLDGS